MAPTAVSPLSPGEATPVGSSRCDGSSPASSSLSSIPPLTISTATATTTTTAANDGAGSGPPAAAAPHRPPATSGKFRRLGSTVSAVSLQPGSTRRRRVASLAAVPGPGSTLTSSSSSSAASSSSSSSSLKCVVVGDDAIGKTSMLMGYATHRYPTRHVPSVFNNYAGTVKVSGRTLHLEIIDTLEEDESPSSRYSEYPGTDIFVLCFSVVRPETLRHVQDTWLPEIRAHAPPESSRPFILAGTQADLREVDEIVDLLKERGEDPVTVAQGWGAARRLGAACYIECSPGVEKKLRKIFNASVAAVLKARQHAKPMIVASSFSCTSSAASSSSSSDRAAASRPLTASSPSSSSPSSISSCTSASSSPSSPSALPVSVSSSSSSTVQSTGAVSRRDRFGRGCHQYGASGGMCTIL